MAFHWQNTMLEVTAENREQILTLLNKTLQQNPWALTQEGRACQAIALMMRDLQGYLAPVDVFSAIERLHRHHGFLYTGGPRQLPSDLQEHRSGFLQEELTEYVMAVQDGDLEKQFDSLLDLIEVALGTLQLHGFPAREGYKRVHDANMRKVRVKDAKESPRKFHMDLKKPEGWEPPQYTDLLK